MNLLNPKTGAVHLHNEESQQTVCGYKASRFQFTEDEVTCRACKGGYNQTRPVWQDTKHHFVAMGLSEQELREIARDIQRTRTEIEITDSISIWVP